MNTPGHGWIATAAWLLCVCIASGTSAEESLGEADAADGPIELSALAVTDEVLEDARGQGNVTWLTVNEADVAAEVTGNQVTSSPTGHNQISDAAFGDAAGFTTVIQNTGNHVVIQDVTIINITVQ